MTGETAARPGRIALFVVVGVLVVCAALAGTFVAIRLMTGDPGATKPVRTRPAPPPAPSTEPTVVAPAPGGIAAEALAVADAIRASRAAWSSHVTGVQVRTVLRRPIVVVSTDIGSEEADLAEEFSSDVGAFAAILTQQGGAPYTYIVEVGSSEGETIGGAKSTDDRWTLRAPTSPASPDALLAWLKAEFGPGSSAPEAWASRITSVTAQPGDMGIALVVSTDLDESVPADLQDAQTIIDAVNASGATFAAEIRVIFADGVFEWSQVLTGVDPYR